MDDDTGFLSSARDMLDIEMSEALRKARSSLNDAAAILDSLGICYILKICESSDEVASPSSISVVCKCSSMRIGTAAALLEYEQRRFIDAISDREDTI